MANNRMYLECSECREAIFLAKTMGRGYYTFADDGKVALNAFFDAHEVCATGNENVFRLVYESGDPEMSVATRIWQPD